MENSLPSPKSSRSAFNSPTLKAKTAKMEGGPEGLYLAAADYHVEPILQENIEVQ